MREAPIPAGRAAGWVAYVLATLTALLWVACVLPAGRTSVLDGHRDLETPIHREAALLVPALLLLQLVPVGMTLARRVRGARAVLAATDAFIAAYAAVALWRLAPPGSAPRVAFAVALGGLAALSFLEVRRCMKADTDERRPGPLLHGVRLALCVLVLMTPPQWLLRGGEERASILGPFLLVAIGAAGGLAARRLEALRAVSACIQTAIACHVVVALRFTLLEREPAIVAVGPAGSIAMGLALALAATAGLQAVLLAIVWQRARGRAAGRIPPVESAPA